jgi:hypothetical protein
MKKFLSVFLLSLVGTCFAQGEDRNWRPLIEDVYFNQSKLGSLEKERLWYIGAANFWDGLSAALANPNQGNLPNGARRPRFKLPLSPKAETDLKKNWGPETEGILREARVAIARLAIPTLENVTQFIRENRWVPTKEFIQRYYPDVDVAVASNRFEVILNHGEGVGSYELQPWAEWVRDLVLLNQLRGKITLSMVQNLNWGLIRSEGVPFLRRQEVQSALGLDRQKIAQFGMQKTKPVDTAIQKETIKLKEMEEASMQGFKAFRVAQGRLETLNEKRKRAADQVYFEVLKSLNRAQKQRLAHFIGEEAAKEVDREEVWLASAPPPPAGPAKKAIRKN